MKIYLICAASVLGVLSLILLILHIKTLKPLRSILLHALLGFAALAVINLTARYTGVKIPVNLYSVIGSGVFGIPAVCGFLILNLII